MTLAWVDDEEDTTMIANLQHHRANLLVLRLSRHRICLPDDLL